MVTVLGEIPSPATCLAGIAAVLRPGGLLSLTEQSGDPDAFGEVDLRQMGARVGLGYRQTYKIKGGFTLNLAKR